VARGVAPVVVTGEPGCGKEVVARAIHANGRNRKGPFVTAGPATFVERMFEEARGGTLFLDDVGSLSPAQQARLLLVVQDSEDPRILCAPHGDLRKAVAQGWFREDLYYRLKVFSLEVPPLRARPEDVVRLAGVFLPDGMRFTPGAEDALRAYPWPGNVRELQNAVRHAATFASGPDVDLECLPSEIVRPPRTPLRPLADVEREHILRTMEACGGRHAEAARVLGIGRTTLWRKLNEYGGAQQEQPETAPAAVGV
jgi:two-component system response regulator HydG